MEHNRYLFLDDISQILGKSWSFCQKEVKSGRIIGEKKYILGKRKFVIKREDFLNYVRNNPERVGNIENIQENIESVSKTLSELEAPQEIHIEAKTTPHVKKEVFVTQENKQTETPSYHSSPKEEAQNQSISEIEAILKNLQLAQKSDGNDLYIEQLLKTIDDLKKSKVDEKSEYKERISGLENNIHELQEELRAESRKVERSFFISDRYEKALVKQNELLLNMIHFIQTLWDGREVSLWEVKSLLAWYGVNEQIVIDEHTRDIKLVNQTNTDFYERLKNVDDDVIIEKSRKWELEEKEKHISTLLNKIKSKNKLIITIFLLICGFGLFFILRFLLSL